MKKCLILIYLITLRLIPFLRVWYGKGKQKRIYFKSTGNGRKGRTEFVYHFADDTFRNRSNAIV